ncbi:replication associated protein [Capybara associated cyclovirus 1]|uniref:Replication-associated protein n=1 Tax=Capybara associated cyclovirus 1 TaxID=2604905 RepID=A0A5P8PNA8_9CIRC|nr:replication associated protein [Capybara associated cyclovirus 1]QFR58251.1 replication associated protein [Capybara associated cyclovirus 1]
MPRVRRRIKRVCFTLNNYTEDDEQRIQQYANDYEYCIYGREIAPSTGTHHLQGFINFKVRREFATIKRIIGNTAHIEPSNGTDVQNKEYCSKGNNIWEYGKPSKQGKRSDLDSVVETIKSARTLADIVSQHPSMYIRYHRGIEKLFGYIGTRQKREWKTYTTILYGESGVGKSRAALEKAQGNVYYKTRGEWWDNYKGEETVIIDDFYGWIKLDEMLRITDRYALQVPVKGGFVEFLAYHIYITSNKEPLEWYKFTNDNLKKAFIRRLDKIYYCTQYYTEKIKLI